MPVVKKKLNFFDRYYRKFVAHKTSRHNTSTKNRIVHVYGRTGILTDMMKLVVFLAVQ